MHVLFDVAHPAHAHFFREPAKRLIQQGHRISLTSRAKDVTLPLLDELGIEHIPLSSQKTGVVGLFGELIQRDLALWKQVRRLKPDVMAAIGGTFIAHVSKLSGVPALVFYDTENAKLQNAITYPFATQVFAPRAYQSWLPKHSTRYPGYHELAYLHPDIFQPNRERAIAAGLAEKGDTFLLRLVSWQANHDIGENGWNQGLLRQLVDKLQAHGKVLISSEAPLPEHFAQHAYPGPVADIHHLMAFCRAHIGESATMASESAVLGVPAIYAAETGRGYTDEQETRYRLVTNLRQLDWPQLEAASDALLSQPPSLWKQRQQTLLDDCIDVADYVVQQCLTHSQMGDQGGGH